MGDVTSLGGDALLTPDEAAARLRVSRSFLAKKRVSGGGPKFVRIGRRVRYSPPDLDAFVCANRRASTSEGGR